jgi:hypothetical protein
VIDEGVKRAPGDFLGDRLAEKLAGEKPQEQIALPAFSPISSE